MSVNYLNLSILLVILLISVIIILYHIKRKQTINQLLNYKKDIFELELVENFDSNTNNNLKVKEIKMLDNNNIIIKGNNLGKIKEIYFGYIKLKKEHFKLEKCFLKIDGAKIINFLKKDYFGNFKKGSNLNLELRFLIEIKEKADNLNIIFPTNLYFNLEDKGKASLTYNTSNTDTIEYNPLKNYINQIKNIKKQNEPADDGDNVDVNDEDNLFSINTIKVGINKENKELINLSWVKPIGLDTDNYSYLLNIKSLNENTSNTFEIKNESLTYDTTEYNFAKDQLTPFETYKIKLEVLEYQPIQKRLHTVEINYTFNPSDAENYHIHKFNEKNDLKFSTNKEDITADNLLDTYYNLLAYNKNKSNNNFLKHDDNFEILSNNLDKKINNLIDGNHLDKFDTTFIDNVNKFSEEENIMFSETQIKQNDKIKKIKYKLSELEKLKNKKDDNLDLTIKSLVSRSDGTILRLKDLGNLNKLVLLNNGCLAFDKNNFGKIKSIGYIPCNTIDPEQQFTLKRINTLDDYNLLLSLNLEESVSEDSNFRSFYILQPIGTNKCVHINNKNISIKKCTDTNDIKFTANFVPSKCNF